MALLDNEASSSAAPYGGGAKVCPVSDVPRTIHGVVRIFGTNSISDLQSNIQRGDEFNNPPRPPLPSRAHSHACIVISCLTQYSRPGTTWRDPESLEEVPLVPGLTRTENQLRWGFVQKVWPSLVAGLESDRVAGWLLTDCPPARVAMQGNRAAAGCRLSHHAFEPC